MTRILLCLMVLMAVCYQIVQGGLSMDEICQKHKDHGRCGNRNIKKQCPKACGGGDDQVTSTPSQTDTTQKSAVTTTKSSNSGGGGGGGGKKCDKRSPCVSMDDANAAFRKRCEAAGDALKASCYDHCRYDQDTAAMKKAFLGGPCPLAQLRTFLTAASNGKDNTPCCEDQGVLAQKKTGVCGCFCNPTGPVWPQKGETAKYAPCVGVLQGIINCHYYAEGAD